MQLTKYNNLSGLNLEQKEKLYKLREAIARSEALYKERHLNIYDHDSDSDDDEVDEDKIYSYYFNEDQDEDQDEEQDEDHEEDHNEDQDDNYSENDYNIEETEPESDVVIYDIPDSSCDYASYVVDQMLYGRLSDRVKLLPDGAVTLVLSEQCSATL